MLQGSGTFGIESVISSTVSQNGRLLVIQNGEYGKRIAQIARIHKIDTIELAFPENTKPDLKEIRAKLVEDPNITDVAAVHCETSTGMLNPIEEIGQLINQTSNKSRKRAKFFVDAMSSFGAVPLSFQNGYIDSLVTSANKVNFHLI
jgi:2-aminoethylphosphonate-pyruvate transaminase